MTSVLKVRNPPSLSSAPPFRPIHGMLRTMSRRVGLLISLGIVLLVLAGTGLWAVSGMAPEDGPERELEIVVPFTETTWWLTRWADNQIECVINTDHDNLPTHNEVFAYCGRSLYDEWVGTPLCPQAEAGEPTDVCRGLYLFLASKQPLEKTILIELPRPSVTLTLADCELVAPANRCERIPELVFTGDEPLPNERITAIHWQLAGEEYSCDDPTCTFPLPFTGLDGEELTFWAESSYGDTTEEFTAQVRVVDEGAMGAATEGQGWFVDVLSSQWRGGEIASCAAVWEAFPPVGLPPDWLSTPEELDELSTGLPYVYLAGRLIAQGAVDASSCPAGGLSDNGTANTCGLEQAREMVNEWQDRFDAIILDVARETTVPAQLMKKLFALESQFWPGVLIPEEFGLGQMTELGADATLLWNTSFFADFCPLVLEESACAGGYLHLEEKEQALLRGALAARTDARCPTCPLGIDLTHAEFSVEVFANTLLGNCEQAGRVVRNTTDRKPGEVSSYEDLWRFTLVNYNAGPGCLAQAMNTTWRADRVLNWANLSSRLEAVCENAVEYVDQIAREPTPTPTATVPVTATATQVLSPTPDPQATATPPGPYPPPVSPSPPPVSPYPPPS